MHLYAQNFVSTGGICDKLKSECTQNQCSANCIKLCRIVKQKKQLMRITSEALGYLPYCAIQEVPVGGREKDAYRLLR